MFNIKNFVSRILFSFAKQPRLSSLLGATVGFGFEHLYRFIPVKHLIKTEKVLVFYHPKPSWKDHALIVPKKSIRNLLELGQPQNTEYFIDILLAAKEVIQLTYLTGKGYVLCANGGSRQEVQQVHFHLFTKESYVNPFVQPIPEKTLYENDKIQVFNHPNANWQIHLIILPKKFLPSLAQLTSLYSDSLQSIIEVMPKLNAEFNLTRLGYTFLIQEFSCAEKQSLICHIVAGNKIIKSSGKPE